MKTTDIAQQSQIRKSQLSLTSPTLPSVSKVTPTVKHGIQNNSEKVNGSFFDALQEAEFKGDNNSSLMKVKTHDQPIITGVESIILNDADYDIEEIKMHSIDTVTSDHSQDDGDRTTKDNLSNLMIENKLQLGEIEPLSHHSEILLSSNFSSISLLSEQEAKQHRSAEKSDQTQTSLMNHQSIMDSGELTSMHNESNDPFFSFESRHSSELLEVTFPKNVIVQDAKMTQPVSMVLSSTTVISQSSSTTQLPADLTLNHSENNEKLQTQLQVMMSKGLKQVDIRLDPPELGKVQIKLTVNQDQAQVLFSVTQPQTREWLEQTIPRLRELFLHQGLQLDQADIHQQSNSSQQQETLHTPYDDEEQSTSLGRDLSSDEAIKVSLSVPITSDRIDYYA